MTLRNLLPESRDYISPNDTLVFYPISYLDAPLNHADYFSFRRRKISAIDGSLPVIRIATLKIFAANFRNR